jgi:hypothetical protein
MVLVRKPTEGSGSLRKVAEGFHSRTPNRKSAFCNPQSAFRIPHSDCHAHVTALVTATRRINIGKMRFVTTSRLFTPVHTSLCPPSSAARLGPNPVAPAHRRKNEPKTIRSSPQQSVPFRRIPNHKPAQVLFTTKEVSWFPRWSYWESYCPAGGPAPHAPSFDVLMSSRFRLPFLPFPSSIRLL